MADLIQFRRDTAERWAAANPVLAEGELGLVLGSSNQYKVGDGVTPWNSLPIKGFNGNILDELGSNYDAVISQAGLTLILKNIVNNGSNVKLSEIDNLNKKTDIGWYAIVNKWNLVIGHMLITADPMGHTVNQWVFGNYTVEGNQISITHTDGQHSILVRSYYLGGGSDILQKNVWTKWKYYQQEFIKSTQNNSDGEQWTYGAESIQLFLTTLQKSLQGEVDKLNNSMIAAFKETNANVSNLNRKFNNLNARADDIEDIVNEANSKSDTTIENVRTLTNLVNSSMTVRFYGFTSDTSEVLIQFVINPQAIIYHPGQKFFVAMKDGKYYNNWPTAKQYKTDVYQGNEDKIYIFDLNQIHF